MKFLLPIYGFVLAFQATSVKAWSTSIRSTRFSSTLGHATTRTLSTVSLKAVQSTDDTDTNTISSFYDPLQLSQPSDANSRLDPPRALLIATTILFLTPEMAMAATSSSAVPSALAAYGHYLSILIVVASIMTERLTVKPAMTIEEEKLLSTADIMTGIAGTALLISGYYRATAYGKGWDFYSHEPIFWLKMTFLGIFGALSLFPTITIIQRAIQIQNEGSIEPMSEELATRMKKILNAELTALAFIPLTACLMARGVGYVNDFPTEIVGPAVFAVVTGGAVVKYVKDAITWKEPGTAETELLE